MADEKHRKKKNFGNQGRAKNLKVVCLKQKMDVIPKGNARDVLYI